METLKTVLVNFAVVSLVCSIFEYLTPSRNKEIMKIISSVILISLVVTSLFKLDFKNTFDKTDFNFSENTLSEDGLTDLKLLMEKEVYKNIENVLINEGVREYEINMKSEIDFDSAEISLTEIKILSDKSEAEKISRAEKELEKEYGDILKFGEIND